MHKYIERDAFIAWLKKIPMVDLSDGRGICRVIMEDDFKKAIKNMPESIIHDSEVEVVRCRACVHAVEIDGTKQCELGRADKVFGYSIISNDGFCDRGERK